MLRDTSSPISETTAEALPPSPSHTISRWRHVIPQRVASTFASIAAFFVAVREFLKGDGSSFTFLHYTREALGGDDRIAGLICKVCRVDIHDEGETCALQKEALCSTCGQFVLLDYYGKCMPSGERWPYHEIVTSTIRPIQHAAPTQPPNGEMVMSG
jgi:hypothetical protein